MKTVKITVTSDREFKRAQYAANHLSEIAYALNGVTLEIERGTEPNFDCGGSEDADYIVLCNFIFCEESDAA